MANQKMAVLGRKPPMRDPEGNVVSDKPRWMRIGFATKLEDGRLLVSIDALPLGFDGQLRIVDVVYTEGE